ncbi:Sulfoacetaldehyde reductase [Rubripirellula lacrimiformis]|uniref:Sulfoacetaldehyde reductase n=1 Tax=Rubripirellula lacrimiformis TaxID=1930273 RepID=A0A517N4H6_9BACT|nr:SDR family oxidoreductase [Rubripirellula lacrimiformis]QDT02037.1 Sulfoacetaldehyde reductase [Rubripirellula lacrimiformis]
MTTTLITGASSGIGKELAKLFARDGDDLVLVARSKGKLDELADQLSSAYQISATAIESDLSKHDAVDRLCGQLAERSLSVDTLVNNAGFGQLGAFAELDADRQTNMVMVNVTALTRLTRQLLPPMIHRGRGGILNVGSIAGYQAGPHMAVYYATKAYVLSFTEALREELSESGLHVTLLAPGPTKTGFGDDSEMGKLEMFASQAMSAEDVAKAGFDGYRKNEDIVVPGWRNRLMATSTSFVPRFLTRKIVGKLQKPGSP